MISRVPTRYPMNLERSYSRDLGRLIGKLNKSAMFLFSLHLKSYFKDRGLKLDDADDDPNWFDKVNAQIELFTYSMRQTVSQQDMEVLADKFVRSLNQFSYTNVKAQTKIIGIDPISDNPELRNMVQANIKNNVKLIKSLSDRYFDDIEKDIYRTLTEGGGVGSITDNIVKRTGMARKHAELIANDQTGSIISGFNSYRAKKAGAERYIWRSMEDSRVRPKHRELDGKTFSYDDPNGGDNGQRPGEPIRCRCVAYPIF